MKLSLYLVGGFLLWTGGYAYLRTRNYAGSHPLDGTGAAALYSLFGSVSQFLVIPYLIALGFIFSWWMPIAFAVVVGLGIGMLSATQPFRVAGAGLTIVLVPLGIALAAVAFLV